MAERRAWSVISLERLAVYNRQAEQLVELARQHQIPAFAAALAGVAFIHNAIGNMGGTIDWWIEMLRDPTAIRRYVVAGEPGGRPAPGPGGKQ